MANRVKPYDMGICIIVAEFRWVAHVCDSLIYQSQWYRGEKAVYWLAL